MPTANGTPGGTKAIFFLGIFAPGVYAGLSYDMANLTLKSTRFITRRFSGEIVQAFKSCMGCSTPFSSMIVQRCDQRFIWRA